jgi:hypothetical protein
LVDYNIVGINAKLGKFLNETFSLVNGEEFRNANADLESGKKLAKLSIGTIETNAHRAYTNYLQMWFWLDLETHH